MTVKTAEASLCPTETIISIYKSMQKQQKIIILQAKYTLFCEL